MSSIPPIFIVGFPRSGTTLLSAFLSSHSALSAGAETHIYNKLFAVLDTREKNKLLQNWPDNALVALSNLRLSGRPVIDLYQTNISSLGEKLKQDRPSYAAILRSLTELQCSAQNKQQWIEKTPNHLLHVQAIRKDFPQALIIRVVRDHRDIADSLQYLPWAAQSSIANALLIEDWHCQSRHFFDNDVNALTIKFEDLISQTELVLRALCKKLNIQFETEMLNREGAKAVANLEDEPWKKEVYEQINHQKICAWKKQNSEQNKYLYIDNICVNFISSFDYCSAQLNSLIHSTEELAQFPPCYLLRTTGQKFTYLDDLAETLLKSKIRLVNDKNTKNVLVLTEDNFFIDAKLFVKAFQLRLFAKRQVVYLKQNKTNGVLRALFFRLAKDV